MKRLMLLLFFAVLFSCKEETKIYPKIDNPVEAGREFIDAFLKGDSDKAAAYMIDDAENQSLLKKLHRQLKNRSEEDKQGYKESSILIEQGGIEYVTENEVIIQYKATYDRIPRKIKVINKNGTWLVDLKYTVNPNL